MSNDPAQKRQGFERWVASLRIEDDEHAGAEESDVASLDEQATLVQRLPKEVVRRLREREANRYQLIDDEHTAVFVPPPELLARARRMVPPPKPERSSSPSMPPASSKEADALQGAVPSPSEQSSVQAKTQPAWQATPDPSDADPPTTPAAPLPASQPGIPAEPVALEITSEAERSSVWSWLLLCLTLAGVAAWFFFNR